MFINVDNNKYSSIDIARNYKKTYFGARNLVTYAIISAMIGNLITIHLVSDPCCLIKHNFYTFALMSNVGFRYRLTQPTANYNLVAKMFAV